MSDANFVLKNYLSPLDPPTIQPIPDKVIKSGATLAITCEVTSANPLPNTYTWTKVGDNGFTQTGPVLTISNIQLSHAGTYRCTAVNRMVASNGRVQQGSDRKDIAVKVQLQCRYFQAGHTRRARTNGKGEFHKCDTGKSKN